MPELPDSTRQFNAEILADRARRANKKCNLARYAEAMTPRAAFIEGQRAKRRQAVENSIKAAEEADRQEARATARLPRYRQQEAARTIFSLLKYGDESARREAAQMMNAAPEKLRAAVMKLAEVDSAFKIRRSNQSNGF